MVGPKSAKTGKPLPVAEPGVARDGFGGNKLVINAVHPAPDSGLH
jgi:hypothetical protein